MNDASGFSPFPGNINQLIMKLPDYADVLEETKGLVPEFVNPKYKVRAHGSTDSQLTLCSHPRLYFWNTFRMRPRRPSRSPRGSSV